MIKVQVYLVRKHKSQTYCVNQFNNLLLHKTAKACVCTFTFYEFKKNVHLGRSLTY